MPTTAAAALSGAVGDRPGRTAVVVLAGGGARRWGGRDKTAVLLAGRPVLGHVLAGARAAFGPAAPVVVVGPAVHPAAADLAAVRAVVVREEPAGGGPVAGLAAGLAALPGGPDGVVVVAVVAGDVPFGGPALLRAVRVLRSDPTLDGVLGVDPRGYRQPLLAAYRAAPLRAALAAAPASGRAVRALLDGLRLGSTPMTARECLDLDTPDDLAAAEALVE